LDEFLEGEGFLTYIFLNEKAFFSNMLTPQRIEEALRGTNPASELFAKYAPQIAEFNKGLEPFDKAPRSTEGIDRCNAYIIANLGFMADAFEGLGNYDLNELTMIAMWDLVRKNALPPHDMATIFAYSYAVPTLEAPWKGTTRYFLENDSFHPELADCDMTPFRERLDQFEGIVDNIDIYMGGRSGSGREYRIAIQSGDTEAEKKCWLETEEIGRAAQSNPHLDIISSLTESFYNRIPLIRMALEDLES